VQFEPLACGAVRDARRIRAYHALRYLCVYCQELRQNHPITILLLLASTTSLTVSYTGWTAFSFSFGVFAGSMVWWLALSSAVWALRQRLNTTALRRSNQAAALALAGFGCLVLVQGVKALKASAPQAREMASTRTGSSAPHDQ
jgi:hypothetical protein